MWLTSGQEGLSKVSDGKNPWRRATHSVFLPGESPRTEEPGGLQCMGSQSQTRLSDQAHKHIKCVRNFLAMLWTAVGVVLPFLFPSSCWLGQGPCRCGDGSFQPFRWEQHFSEWQNRQIRRIHRPQPGRIIICSPGVLMSEAFHEKYFNFCLFLTDAFAPGSCTCILTIQFIPEACFCLSCIILLAYLGPQQGWVVRGRSWNRPEEDLFG